jgi:hypothetical protein|tara:strand:+ start:2089 stop:2427 length:339 start_codon:yes stop_codon:yes gene_type:complete
MINFEMPAVEMGDFINYTAHEDAIPNLGIVTEVSSRSIKCWVIVPDYGGIEKYSVHHKDDPGLEEFPEWKRFGMWFPKKPDAQIAVLSEKLALLEKKIGVLEGRKAKTDTKK